MHHSNKINHMANDFVESLREMNGKILFAHAVE